MIGAEIEKICVPIYSVIKFVADATSAIVLLVHSDIVKVELVVNILLFLWYDLSLLFIPEPNASTIVLVPVKIANASLPLNQQTVVFELFAVGIGLCGTVVLALLFLSKYFAPGAKVPVRSIEDDGLPDIVPIPVSPEIVQMPILYWVGDAKSMEDPPTLVISIHLSLLAPS